MSRILRRRLFQSAVLIGALSMSAMAVPALAQERTFTFDIPAESLSKALRDYGQATHQQLVFTEDLTAGKSAPAVKGAFSAPAALALILKGSGLGWERTPTGALVLRSDRPAVASIAPVADEIIVTANKKSETLSSVGEGISAVSGDKLEKMNANNLEDYLGFVPGVAFTSFGRPGQNQITIRGVAALGLGAAIATYVDEIPVGSASNEAQGSNYTPDLDPADLDHVEVLKGPQGTLYGASSLGGLLKYVTRAPSLTKTDLSAGAEVNSIDGGGEGYKLRLAGGTPIIKDVLGVRASAYYRDDPGFIHNDLTGAKEVNADRTYGGRIAFLYQPIDKLQIKLGAIYQNVRADGLNAVSYNAAPNLPPPFKATYGDLDQHLHLAQPNAVKDQIYSAEIHYDLGWAKLLSATGVSREDIYRYTDVTGTYTRPSYFNALHEPVGSTASLVNDYHIYKTSEEVRLQSNPSDKFEWVVGAVYLKETSTTDGTVNIRNASGVLLPQPAGIASVSYTDNDLKEYAGFANATWYILPQFDLSAGYRRSHITQRNESLQYGYVFEPATPTVPINRVDNTKNDVDTWSFGARWRVTDYVMLYARAASGFRPGGGRPQPPLVIPNYSFTYNPDSVWSYETGVKGKAWDGRITADVDVFYIDWSHTQTLIPAVVGQPYLVQGNAGDAVSKGIEGQFTITPFKGLTASTALAYTDAHFTQTVGSNIAGIQLQFSPRFTGALQVDYERPVTETWNGFIGADYRYRSSMLDAVDVKNPGYGQVGFHIGAEHERTRISFSVVNLTNRRGLLGYTGGGNQTGDPYRYAINPPRTVSLSISQRF